MTRVWSFAVAVLAAGCATVPSQKPEATRPVAPWSNSRLQPNAVPAVFTTEHAKAENRSTCALLVPTNVPADAKPRRATFAGGWAVAYDQPGHRGVAADGSECASCGRSAFGVAGAGVEAESGTFDWPNRIEYADGSRAGYGLEGGNGPGWLAYITIPGQHCLYNVWSHGEREELERLIASLRLVD